MILGRTKGLYERSKVLFLPVDAIQPNPNQPRRTFAPDALEELAQSIGRHGILQPLSVRRTLSGGYELIAGERRLRAARLAGLEEVPCLLVGVDEEGSSLLALIENLQRRDLDFVEEASALRRLIDAYGLSQEEAARRLGKSQSAVANKLRLLRLPEDVLALLRDHGCSERHARALLRLNQPDLQRQAAKQVMEEELTVSRTEALVEELLHPKAPPPSKVRAKPRVLLKDVRLFLNAVTRGLALMKDAGVNAQCDRQDSEEEILLTIHIPNRSNRKEG